MLENTNMKVVHRIQEVDKKKKLEFLKLYENNSMMSN